MKKFLIISLVLLIPHAYAYVSPESYAVNEADFTDYTKIPPPPKINIDSLDDERFQAPDLIEAKFPIIKEETIEEVKADEKKQKKQNKEDLEPYQKRLSYKIAKWWVDQRYKREEEHHGALHEIKVDKRIQYENSLKENQVKE